MLAMDMKILDGVHLQYLVWHDCCALDTCINAPPSTFITALPVSLPSEVSCIKHRTGYIALLWAAVLCKHSVGKPAVPGTRHSVS